MSTVELKLAQEQLATIIEQLSPGDELVIVRDGKPLARLVRDGLRAWPCKAGSAKDTDHWMAADFDGPLDDFAEYMQ